jgi:nucleoside-triphosphatase THEP1
VNGLLSPDDPSGKRFFLSIKNGHSFKFEADDGTEASTITIGSFRFLEAAFQRAHTEILKASEEVDFRYTVIDEVGKLELKTKGLHKAVSQVIPMYHSNRKRHLILVVRDSLLQEVLGFYEITSFQIIDKNTISERLV